uniref:Flavonoid synthase I n=1 Tax=Conocephalum japonicum TaxID=134427 RepID=A0A5J6BU90_CONJP|nr:flavonoid synthase I [Conocephalum japonicum]
MAPPGVTPELVPISVAKLASDFSHVPEKFVLAKGGRPLTVFDDYSKEVPVISLKGIDSESERSRIVAEIGHACAEWGIFQIIDHDVSTDILNRMLEITMGFFNLPLEEKTKYAGKAGSFPVGYASGSHRPDDNLLDWRELFVHRCLPESIRETEYETWPEKPDGYRKTLTEYSDTMDRLMTLLLGLVSESLGLPTNYIKNVGGGEQSEQKVLLNYYPQCPQPDRTLGLRDHTDYGSLTVLQQNGVGGLQVCKEETDTWFAVEPIPGALTCNLGDQIHVLSNGKYRSVEHHVVVNSNHTRLSVVTFANPSRKSLMGPAPELISETNPPKYRNYTFEEYLPIGFAMKTRKAYDAVLLEGATE